ncbi:MAG: hypothetical protein LBV41_03915 [Cytophagaceae bacterium]|jgi:hypothetical protein|nr:hypothetical protein [Cytophagaceae bacterium]
MKTNLFIKALLAVSIALVANSCSTVKYHVVTTVNRDGSFLREIYTSPDSLFLKGDRSRNPYLFKIDSNWQISEVENTINMHPESGFSNRKYKSLTKISSRFTSFENYASQLQYSENLRPMAAPAESLARQFRWFYTYYTFNAVYSSVSERIPVNIDEFMSSDGQLMWFRDGYLNQFFAGMTGLEAKDALDEFEKNTLEWYYRNTFEISFAAIEKYAGEISSNPYASILSEIKDTLFTASSGTAKAKNDETGYSAQYVCQLIDEYLKTDFFSTVYRTNGKEIDKLSEDMWNPVNDLLDKEINCELIMPGAVLASNATFCSGDTLGWKIDFYRLIPGNYTLSAQSRSANVWAFAATLLLAAVAVYCLVRLIGR